MSAGPEAPARGTRRGTAAGSGASQTPLMQQYARIKQDHPDAFLFFRLGDFYEMFFEDAVRGSQILGLTLTSRNKQDPEPIPMCGIPWHQRDAYVGRLLRLGHKVAICDQLEDPAAAKGIVQRGVTEILTPGSVTGDSFLEPASHNYLAAVWPGASRLGLCLADASTGEVRVTAVAWDEAGELLARLRVSEWVRPRSEDLPADDAERLDAAVGGLPGALSPLPAARFADSARLSSRWGSSRLDELADIPEAIAAAAGALDYLDRVQGGTALQMDRVERWRDEDALRFDAATARHLELFQPEPGGENRHTLWHHLDVCVTASGSRRLRDWIERPLAATEAIATRQRAMSVWVEGGAARGALREALRHIPDLERLAGRVACRKATPRDLGAVRDALHGLPAIAAALSGTAADTPAMREALRGDVEVEALLTKALTDDPPPVSRDGGVIRTGYDEQRDALDVLAHSGKRWIADLEASERQRTGIASLKIGYNRVFGYYLEVTRAHLDKVPPDYERRQTLTTAERFVTPGLKVKEGEVLSAEDRLQAQEHELFVAVRERVTSGLAGLRAAAEALASIDALSSLAEAAVRHGWSPPVVDDSDALELDDARHPVVERLLPAGTFVPNDVRLDGQRQILLLTGPNMGGKSTYLRQIALAVVLAQAGSYVPARRARIGLVDRLFTRVGASDRLGAGQSTFMVEMSETAGILRSATPRSLVLLDELGRGTATYDGLALAWAVTEHLHDPHGPRPRTVFATHYHELTQLAERLKRLVNVHVSVKEWGKDLVFLHRIAEGAADRSYGIHVARLAGLPEPVLRRAEEVLHELESERTADHLAARDTKAPAKAEAQPPARLPLFDAVAEHPLLDELRALDPERTTPLEALARIAEWRKRYS